MSAEPERLVMLARGPGFQGPVPGGVAILVRSPDVDRAWQVVVDRV